jgi:hypothetical protein
MNQKRIRTKRIVGPKPRSRFCHHGSPVSRGCALTTTSFSWSSWESALLSANAGTSVSKSVVGFDAPYLSFSVNVPWIAVPFEVISLTCPART